MQIGDTVSILEENHGRVTSATVVSVDLSTGTAVCDVGPRGWQPLERTTAIRKCVQWASETAGRSIFASRVVRSGRPFRTTSERLATADAERLRSESTSRRRCMIGTSSSGYSTTGWSQATGSASIYGRTGNPISRQLGGSYTFFRRR